MTSSTDVLGFHDLSHPWGDKVSLWPYFPDVKIERFHYHAKSRVLSQQITTFMHSTTHTDAPAHVIEGAPFMDEVPLDRFFLFSPFMGSSGLPSQRIFQIYEPHWFYLRRSQPR